MIARVSTVEDSPVGASLEDDTAAGATELVVDFAAPFLSGDTLRIEDEVLEYTAVDEGTGTITLAGVTAVDHPRAVPVVLYPLVTVRIAHLLRSNPPDGEEEGMAARVPHSLYDRVPTGAREEGRGEVVEAAFQRDVLVVTDVLDKEPAIDASYLDEGTGAVVLDGEPPASSPTPTLLGAISFLLARWEGVANHDEVTYEVHVSTTTGFTPDGDTLAGETNATGFAIRDLPDGTPLAYDTTYYVKLFAKDGDGGGWEDPTPAASAQDSAQLAQVDTPDIAVDAIIAEHILAGEITADKLEALLVLSNVFATASSGQRVEFDTDGIRLYASDGTTVLVNIPTDGSDPQFLGHLDALGLDLTAGSSETPPDDQRVRWLDGSNAITSLFGYQSGNFNVFRGLVETDASHTQALADLKLLRYTDDAVLAWLKVQGHNTDGSTRAISATVRLDDGSIVERVLQDNLGRSSYQLAYSGLARCNSTLTLTTSEQDVSGCSFTVPYTGTYILTGVFECIVTTGGTAHVGVLNVNGSTQTGQAILAGTSGMIATVAQQWRLNLTAGHTVKLRASKNGAGGTLSVGTDHTTLTWHHVVTD